MSDMESQPHTLSILTDEQLAALGQVDVRLAFVNHGSRTRLPGFGVAVIGPAERDYDATKWLTDGMGEGHGDQLIVEGVASKHSEGVTNHYNDISQELFEHALSDRSLDNPLAKDVRWRAPLEHNLEHARSARSVGPTDYAIGHALLKGARASFGDMHRQEDAQAWAETLASLPRIQQLLLFDVLEYAEMEHRDGFTLKCLGDAAIVALQTRQATSERPIVAYAGGENHAVRIKQRLDALGVSYVAKETSLIPQNTVPQKWISSLLYGTRALFLDATLRSLRLSQPYRALRKQKRAERQ